MPTAVERIENFELNPDQSKDILLDWGKILDLDPITPNREEIKLDVFFPTDQINFFPTDQINFELDNRKYYFPTDQVNLLPTDQINSLISDKPELSVGLTIIYTF